MSSFISGGCQCGAIRFRIDGPLGRPSICHCRMCQKATGGFFGPYVSAEVKHLTWTRGALKHFQSSNKVRRGFCEACGTPLTFEYNDEVTELAIGAFDDPEAAAPVIQMVRETRLSFIDRLADLPERSAKESAANAIWQSSIVSHQHPDHDTEVWPPADGRSKSRP